MSPKKKDVILLSTEHHSKALIRELNNKPEIIKTYNESKGGVDAFDQLLELNTRKRKTNRWVINVLCFIVDCCSQNAHALTLL